MRQAVKITFVLVWLCSIAYGQTINYAYHGDSGIPSNIVSIGNRSYFVEQSQRIPICCYDHISLVCIDANGTIKFRKDLGGWSYPDLIRIAATADKQLVISAGTQMKHCDTGPSEYKLFSCDTSGQVLWEHMFYNKPAFMVPLSDSTLYFQYENTWIHTNKDGIAIAQFSYSLAGLQGICGFGPGQMLISYALNNSPTLRLTNDSLQLIEQHPIQHAIRDIARSANGSVLGIYNGVIQRYSSTFNYMPVAISGLGNSYSVTSFIQRNDTVFATGVDSQEHAFYAVLNANLQTLHMSVSNVEKAASKGITLTEHNRIRIITGQSYNPGTHTYIGLMEIGLSGTLGAKHDVGPVGVTITGSNVTSYAVYGQVANNPIIEMDVTIANHGSDTVRTFHLNHYAFVSGIAWCIFGLNKKIERKIAPGDTVVVNTGTFNLSPFYTPSTAVQSPPVDICIFTTVPDSANDVDISNDKFCMSTSLPLAITGIQADQNSVSIHPNPSTGIFTVSSLGPITQLQIFDCSGIKLGEYKPNEHSLTVRQELGSGVYYLRVRTNEEVKIKRLLIIK